MTSRSLPDNAPVSFTPVTLDIPMRALHLPSILRLADFFKQRAIQIAAQSALRHAGNVRSPHLWQPLPDLWLAYGTPWAVRGAWRVTASRLRLKIPSTTFSASETRNPNHFQMKTVMHINLLTPQRMVTAHSAAQVGNPRGGVCDG